MAFFEAQNMTGSYGKGPNIIHSCSVNVDKGEIVSILGPNGAGKSTAMKAMLGLLNLKTGSIVIGGKDISSLSLGFQFTHEYKKLEYNDPYTNALFGEVAEGILVSDQSRYILQRNIIYFDSTFDKFGRPWDFSKKEMQRKAAGVHRCMSSPYRRPKALVGRQEHGSASKRHF